MPKKIYSLTEISKFIGIPFSRDSKLAIDGIASLKDARAGQISFLSETRQQKYLATTQASAIIVKPEWATMTHLPALITHNPYLVYAKVATLFDDHKLPAIGIHPTAIIGNDCDIDPTARIGAYCVVDDGCSIGANSCLWPRVTLYQNTVLGDRVTVHSGAVIGCDGFGNAHDGKSWVKIPQLGKVIIGNQVEIGANTTIDRGTLGDTVIEDGVRLDNQIQIAHNVRIGAHTAIAACTGIAGSTSIGKHCMIGGGVGITGHITICDFVIIAAMTGVSKSIAKPGTYASVSTAQTQKSWQRMSIRLRQLDALFNRVAELEKQLAH